MADLGTGALAGARGRSLVIDLIANKARARRRWRRQLHLHAGESAARRRQWRRHGNAVWSAAVRRHLARLSAERSVLPGCQAAGAGVPGEVRELPRVRLRPRRQPGRQPDDVQRVPQLERRLGRPKASVRSRSVRSRTTCTRARSRSSRASRIRRASAGARRATSRVRITPRARTRCPSARTRVRTRTSSPAASRTRTCLTTPGIPRRPAPAAPATTPARPRPTWSRTAVRSVWSVARR